MSRLLLLVFRSKLTNVLLCQCVLIVHVGLGIRSRMHMCLEMSVCVHECLLVVQYSI